jgi:hypothetical protein
MEDVDVSRSDRWRAEPLGSADERQLIPQLPGPRGSPQVPHAPTGAGAADLLLETAANTDHCFSRPRLLHAGQDGWRSPVTNVSNRCWQSRQMYSKMGINHSLYRGVRHD